MMTDDSNNRIAGDAGDAHTVNIYAQNISPTDLASELGSVVLCGAVAPLGEQVLACRRAEGHRGQHRTNIGKTDSVISWGDPT